MNICTINLNEGDERQIISWNESDKKLYSNACSNPVDDYQYATLDDAIEACDIMWGRSDIVGVWDLKWIEYEE